MKNQAVGIFWQTMSQFGTWFGNKAYLPIGIQLLPITPISEERDNIEWANSIYEPLTRSCTADFQCTISGWSILQLAVLATVGYSSEAAVNVKDLPNESFENAGGNGHSRSNTIWYISTRPEVTNPVPLLGYDKREKENMHQKLMYDLSDCYLPETCTEDVLNRQAGNYTCRVRVSFLIFEKGLTQWKACQTVGQEFPEICGPCDSGLTFEKEEEKQVHNTTDSGQDSPTATTANLQCPPCSKTECESDLNRCPMLKGKTFVCTSGTSKGDCADDVKFWTEQNECDVCCEMTECIVLKDNEAKKLTKDGNALSKPECPPCSKEVCYGELNRCPIHTAPHLCLDGASTGGCSSSPWDLSNHIDCKACCELKIDC